LGAIAAVGRRNYERFGIFFDIKPENRRFNGVHVDTAVIDLRFHT